MRSKRFWFAIFFSCFTGISIVLFFDYRDAHPTTEDAFVKAHVVSISSRVSAPVLVMKVSDNEYVTKGQLLFELEPSSFGADTEEAAANYRIALQKNAARKAMVDSAKSHVQERERLFLQRLKNILNVLVSWPNLNLLLNLCSTQLRQITPRQRLL